MKSKTVAKTQNIYDKMNVAMVDYKGRTNSQEEKTEKKVNEKAEGKGKRQGAKPQDKG